MVLLALLDALVFVVSCRVCQVRFQWDIQGLDAACLNQGPDPAVPLSCGLHIHEGMSCDVGTGDHYYDRARFPTGSPWVSSQYVLRCVVLKCVCGV